MFTQCSKCETVFRLSAEALRAAGGQVRCGRCGEVFNALSRLAEESGGFTTGESSFDLETRAEEILESTGTHDIVDLETSSAAHNPDGQDGVDGVDDSDAKSGVEIAQLQFTDPLYDDPAAETSLEFTLPPGELDRIFIETRRRPLQFLSADDPTDGRTLEDAGNLGDLDDGTATRGADVQDTDPHREPDGVRRDTAADTRRDAHDPKVSAREAGRAGHVNRATGDIAGDLDGTRSPTGAKSSVARSNVNASGNSRAMPLTRIAGLEVSEDVRQEMLASYAHAELPEIHRARRGFPLAAWVAAAVVLSLLLVFQFLRGNSDWLAVHAPLLSGSPSPAANLASYQLRQWGVTGDPSAKGTLRVRASIMNTSAQLQPYPLLRVTLANRFGTRVGAREFEPAEYLGKPTARLFAPGERADATLDILDPGNDAEGFEIDICVRRTDQKVLCASDVAAHGK